MVLDFVKTSRSAEEVGELLTMAGFELEGIEDVEGEKVLDIKVVSNRGDGLSVLGLAREILAKDETAQPTDLYGRAQARFPLPDDGESPPADLFSVELQTEDCTRYSSRGFSGDFSASAPERIASRLRVAGIRSISLLVDLTNYVMLEVGQPLHASDLDTLDGHKIIVRKARAGERLTTLNGEEHELRPDQMMICDANRPVGVAGVMGGQDCEVTPKTTRMMLESAHFLNTSVRRTRKQLGLSTEASYRFERSVDPEGTVAALNRFAELLAEVDGGKSRVPGVLDLYPIRPAAAGFQVRMSEAVKLLGMDVDASRAKGYLSRLGFDVRGDDPFTVTAPSWRPDVVQEYDAIEEIGRIHGYERIPEKLIRGTSTQGGVFGFDEFTDKLRALMMRLGFVENVSHSLRDVHPLDEPRGVRIGPRNPHSPEMAVLRNSLWPCLADNAQRNGGRNLAIFEVGQVFGTEGPLSETRKLAFLAAGTSYEEHWEKEGSPSATFFSTKATLEEVLQTTGGRSTFRACLDPRLHPARQAAAYVYGAEAPAAILGQIHPDLAEQLGLAATTFLCEIGLEQIYEKVDESKGLKPISRNPAVRRDIAILIDRDIAYEDIERAVLSSAGSLLEKIWLFDVYEGKGIPEGKHSLAIALQLRKFGANLTDEEANQARDSAVQALVKLGATQR